MSSRSTFDPAQAKSGQPQSSVQHDEAVGTNKQLKFRQRGQGGAADRHVQADTSGNKSASSLQRAPLLGQPGRSVSVEMADDKQADKEDEEPSAHEDAGVLQQGQNQFLKEAASEEEDDEESNEEDEEDEDDYEDDSSEDEDEEAMLQAELAKIKAERAAKAESDAKIKKEQKEQEIAFGNPLINPSFKVKRKWTDEAIFKDQAKKQKDDSPQLVNDVLHSQYHNSFMDKIIK